MNYELRPKSKKAISQESNYSMKQLMLTSPVSLTNMLVEMPKNMTGWISSIHVCTPRFRFGLSPLVHYIIKSIHPSLQRGLHGENYEPHEVDSIHIVLIKMQVDIQKNKRIEAWEL